MISPSPPAAQYLPALVTLLKELSDETLYLQALLDLPPSNIKTVKLAAFFEEVSSFKLKSTYKGVHGFVFLHPAKNAMDLPVGFSCNIGIKADAGGECKAALETIGYHLDKISELPGFVG